MDQFDKRLKDLYQEKRKLNEKSMPAFNTFLHKLERTKPVSKMSILYKRVAAIAAITIPAALLLYYLNSSKKTGQRAQEIATIKFNKLFPSQSLLNSLNSAPYIWQWRSPTDKFLQEAYKSTNIW